MIGISVLPRADTECSSHLWSGSTAQRS